MSPYKDSDPSDGLKMRAYPSMQYRFPEVKATVPGNNFPSKKISPRCPPQLLHLTSAPATTIIATFALAGVFAPPSRVEAKDGQPVRLLNFASDANNGVLQPAQTNVPDRFSDSRIELKGRSVPPLRKMLYCAPLSMYIHSLSLYVTGYAEFVVADEVASSAAQATLG